VQDDGGATLGQRLPDVADLVSGPRQIPLERIRRGRWRIAVLIDTARWIVRAVAVGRGLGRARAKGRIDHGLILDRLKSSSRRSQRRKRLSTGVVRK
jgi:hypothetical protein